MTKIIVDGKELDVPADYTLLQAAEEAGAEVPRFCFHERLSIAGNCRMCLVEVVGSPKPVASCAMAVKDLRPGPNGEPPVMNTKTPLVKKAREGVMEFLLINHPLDCPICDQGGECDLQDQAMAYGVDTSRYAENKRAVEDKDIGPLVKTEMTRCIHCTRCVRFTTEVAGVADLGATGRGEDMEITTYLEAAMTSEMQGNVIDLCPVGALTSKPYAFKARPWELTKTETIDVMDAVGSAIRVDSRGREVMRIVPRENAAINEEWIADKSRFVWDGLKTQRLDRPYVRKDGKLQPVSWTEALVAAASALKGNPERMAVLAGDLATSEELFALLKLCDGMGITHRDARQDGTELHPRFGRASYIFGSSIAGIDEADAILLVGTNPRWEATVLNARIRKRWREARIPVTLVGEAVDLTYPYTHAGEGPAALKAALKAIPKTAQKPMVIIGQGALARPDGLGILSLIAKAAPNQGIVREGWNGLCILHTAAARVGALDVGFVPAEGGLDTAGIIKAAASGAIDTLLLWGTDEIPMASLGNAKVIYVGTHGDAGANRADIILPAAAYTEKSGLYVNTEGRVQLAVRATFPPGEAKDDWAILRALMEHIGINPTFNSLQDLRTQLSAEHPIFAQWGLSQLTFEDVQGTLNALANVDVTVRDEPFVQAIDDVYLTNPIARASSTMALCSARAAAIHKQAAE